MFHDLLFELPPELLIAFAADTEKLHLFALVHLRKRMFARQANDGRVEWTAKAALTGADQQEMYLIPPRASEERRRAGGTRCRGGNVGDHGFHLVGIWPRCLSRALRAAQLGSSHHLHGFGDLLRRL